MSEIKTYSIPIKNFTFENENEGQFLKTRFFAISEGINLNKSSFELSGMEQCIAEEDYKFKPILGSWDKDKPTTVGMGDFGGHDSDLTEDTMSGEIYNTYLGEKNERPLGVILPSNASIQDYKGKKWLTFEGAIWSEYNREAVRLLKKKRTNNVSVEIRVLESYKDEKGIEIIKKFTLLGITIIGVDAGIPDAHLSLIDFSKTTQCENFIRVFSSKINQNFLKQDEFGTGPELEIDLSKDSASNDNWGEISKTNLRNDLLRAKNYKSIIPKSYLVVMDGWEDTPSEKLKYPIVQIKQGKIVLNINGVQAASSYLMKEKEQPYFIKARAKLNKIRNLLGMDKLFGVEANDDWGDIVDQNQPNIIKMKKEKEDKSKMDKKEIVAKLSALFAGKVQLEEDSKSIYTEYQDKIGDFEYAEDDKKETAKIEMEATKEKFETNQSAIKESEKSIMELSKNLLEMQDGESEDEDIPVDDEEEKFSLAVESIGATYVSKSKSYVVFIKDNEFYASKYKCGDGKELEIDAEMFKIEKLFTIFKVGGSLTTDDMAKMPPVMVEVTKGMSKIYADIKAKDLKIEEIQKMADEKVTNAEKDSEKYKKDVAEFISKFEDLTDKENISKDFKSEVYTKIYNREYASIEDFETNVQASLYKLNKSNFLSGTFASGVKPILANTEKEEVEQIINKYKSKGEK